MALYAYLLRPTGGAATTSDARQAESDLMAAHFRHLQTLEMGQVLRLAGIGGEASFGLVLFEADSAKDAADVMDGDPLVSSGFMGGECVSFQVVLPEGRVNFQP